jgi:hypothetical protein
MITGHGNIKTYLHRHKIIDSLRCPCGHDQTKEHLLLERTLLNKERYSLISAVSRTDDSPTKKHILIRKHYTTFTRFTNQISIIVYVCIYYNKHVVLPSNGACNNKQITTPLTPTLSVPYGGFTCTTSFSVFWYILAIFNSTNVD